MLKYLTKVRDRLLGFLNGVNLYPTKWIGQPETPADIQSKIDGIDTLQEELYQLKTQISIKKKDARKLEKEIVKYIKGMEKKATGFHAEELGALEEYKIKLRKAREKWHVPKTMLVPEIDISSDGLGFSVSTNRDHLAIGYEWERGESTNPQDMNTYPPMEFYRHSSKKSFEDKNVKAGVRYFYRVHAVNSNGVGPWSGIISRIL